MPYSSFALPKATTVLEISLVYTLSISIYEEKGNHATFVKIKFLEKRKFFTGAFILITISGPLC